MVSERARFLLGAGLEAIHEAIHTCDILAKNLAVFCPCPKNLQEAELKRNVLASLAEELSSQHK